MLLYVGVGVGEFGSPPAGSGREAHTLQSEMAGEREMTFLGFPDFLRNSLTAPTCTHHRRRRSSVRFCWSVKIFGGRDSHSRLDCRRNAMLLTSLLEIVILNP